MNHSILAKVQYYVTNQQTYNTIIEKVSKYQQQTKTNIILSLKLLELVLLMYYEIYLLKEQENKKSKR